MRKISQILNTNGDGYWSKEVRAVKVTALVLLAGSYKNEDGSTHYYGELRVKFDTKTWDPSKHGLIYTDTGFLEELKEFLTRAEYNVSDTDYSECGMQGDDYVSLDVGMEFIKSWNATK